MYNPTPWKDHVTNPSNCFNITKNDDGTYQITRAGTVMQQGTPQDAAHFTNQEDGIWELFACYGLLLNYARQMGWDVERGSINLTNTAKPYPFNNSQKTVALQMQRPSNVGKYGKVTGWISVDDAKAGAGLRDQTTDSRGLTKIVIDYASNVQAMAVYNLAQQLDLVAPGYYRSRYIDAAKTAQYIEIGQISAGDAEHVTTLCKKAAIEYKTAA